LSASLLGTLKEAADLVRIDRGITEYIVSVVTATRPAAVRMAGKEGLYQYISFGASPRAAIALYRCCRIRALFEGRSFVSPEDVKVMALPVLRHRIVLSYEAEADGLDPDTVISRILAFVPVP
jgi:MoxR-like ATPase